MTKIIMCGCNGKMGQVISSLVQQDIDAEIVAGIDLLAGKNEYPVFPKFSECMVEADVVIDFSSHILLTEMIHYEV